MFDLSPRDRWRSTTKQCHWRNNSSDNYVKVAFLCTAHHEHFQHKTLFVTTSLLTRRWVWFAITHTVPTFVSRSSSGISGGNALVLPRGLVCWCNSSGVSATVDLTLQVEGPLVVDNSWSTVEGLLSWRTPTLLWVENSCMQKYIAKMSGKLGRLDWWSMWTCHCE